MVNYPLLIEGFQAQEIGFNQILIQSNVSANDRGLLKFIDVVLYDDNGVTAGANTIGNFTISVGSQNIVESLGFSNWGYRSQFGKNKLWDIRTKAQDNQTIDFTVNTTGSTLNFAGQLLAMYTTPEHESFLKRFRLKFGAGLKRKGYQILRPTGNNTPIILRDILSRTNGKIIGLAISNSGNVNNIDNVTTLITVRINGITIIKEVVAGYFNEVSQRMNYLNPIEIQAGATFEMILTPGSLPPLRPSPVPANSNVVHNITFYFDN